MATPESSPPAISTIFAPRTAPTNTISPTPIPTKPHTIVAATGNILHGFSTTAPSHEPDLPNHGELTALYVDPHSWGLGVGVALVSAARAHMVSLGLRQAYLFTLVDNLRAQRFYKADQWTPDGLERTDTVWGAAVHVLRFQRALEHAPSLTTKP